jgi:hypothetical protein
LVLDTLHHTAEDNARCILQHLIASGFVRA